MLFLSAILALWEIQIEGKDGWAAALPCWRLNNTGLSKFTGGRPVTGYHLYMTIFLIGMMHLPLFFAAWSWRLECLLLGFYIGMVMIEDFFWFLFNPHYGIRNFRRGKIWWHKRWWGPVPELYWILLPLAGVLIFLGSRPA
jgi:hypothetical protein